MENVEKRSPTLKHPWVALIMLTPKAKLCSRHLIPDSSAVSWHEPTHMHSESCTQARRDETNFFHSWIRTCPAGARKKNKKYPDGLLRRTSNHPDFIRKHLLISSESQIHIRAFKEIRSSTSPHTLFFGFFCFTSLHRLATYSEQGSSDRTLLKSFAILVWA